MRANDFVPRGASVHSSAGDTLSPYPEKRSGMRPCDSNALLRNRIFPIFSGMVVASRERFGSAFYVLHDDRLIVSAEKRQATQRASVAPEVPDVPVEPVVVVLVEPELPDPIVALVRIHSPRGRALVDVPLVPVVPAGD